MIGRILTIVGLTIGTLIAGGSSIVTVAAEIGFEEPEAPTGLEAVRRIHVEKLAGGETAEQIRAMIIAGIQNTRLFILTEDPERADAILRGAGEDLIYNETHDIRDSVNARGTMSIGSGSRSSSSSSGRSGVYVNSSIGQNESSRSTERKHETSVAVRLVNRAGDIIWSTVQESNGGKFCSASADVARRITKQLVEDHRMATRGIPVVDRPE